MSGPSDTSVQLRMGHSLGKVNDPYIHCSDPQDQICGRVLSMLPLHDERFATLPPHFNNKLLVELTEPYWRSKT